MKEIEGANSFANAIQPTGASDATFIASDPSVFVPLFFFSLAVIGWLVFVKFSGDFRK